MKAIIITYIVIAVLLIILWPQIKASNEHTNKYNCAMQGKEADCKTPLPEERKLK